MPDLRRRTCMCCGKPDSEVGPISWRGNCQGCGLQVMAENVVGIANRSGYAHKRRLRGYVRWAERELLADPQQKA